MSSPTQTPSSPVNINPNGTRGVSQDTNGKVEKRISRIFVMASALLMLSLAGVWVFTEYINHGGWPSGATLGAGGDGVWNLWIIYPMIAGVLLLALRWSLTYVTKPAIAKDAKG